MYRACDVMDTEVITIHQDSTVEDAIRILLDSKLSGAPVVDDRGDVVGLISEYQCLETIYDPSVKKHRVGDLMTTDLLAVDEEARLPDIANLFVMHRLHRIPVLRGQKLVGVVSRRNMLQKVVQSDSTLDDFFDDVKRAVKSSDS